MSEDERSQGPNGADGGGTPPADVKPEPTRDLGPAGVRAARRATVGETLAGGLLWSCAALGLTGCGLLGSAFVFAPVFCWAGLIAITLVVVASSLIVARIRRQRVRTILAYLEHAVRLNLPLPPYLLSAAVSETGATRLRLLDMERLLSGGGSLAHALTFGVPECPTRLAAIVAAAEQNGQPGEALRRLAYEDRVTRERSIDRELFLCLYPLVLLGFGSVLVLGMLYYVVPRFTEIFADYKAPPPALTGRVFAVSDWVTRGSGWVLVAPPLALILLGIIGGYLRRVFVTREQSRLVAPLLDRLRWWLPGLRGLVQNRGLADVCAHLSQALQAGETAPLALQAAAELPDNEVLRSRIARWRGLAERGAGFGDAAAGAGLPPSLFHTSLVGSR